jgi:hypothetical protein
LLQNTLAKGRGQSTRILWNSIDDVARMGMTRRPTITRSAIDTIIIQKLPLGRR